jgi:AcrR family transcriptional regulator
MSKRKFHHGNLRTALLREAEHELEVCGYEALSLRDIAATLRVSRAAPYRHFESKGALLLALAQNGVEQLRLLYKDALEDDAVPCERLRLACKAYLNFSAEKPQLYRLIFVSDTDWLDKLREEVAPNSAFGLFERLVADNLERKDEQSPRVAALACWSIIHGFAMLRMNGRLDSVTDIEAVEHAVLARACK